MGRFEDTPEYQLSMSMQPACNKVLCKVFGVPEANIKRYSKGTEDFILDQHFHIDVVVTYPNGSTTTGQEKTLRFDPNWPGPKTFTMEFYQDHENKIPGEYQKIASQFYLHGYADETGRNFAEWRIIKIFDFINWNSHKPVGDFKLTTVGASRASFWKIYYKDIPERFIFKSSLTTKIE